MENTAVKKRKKMNGTEWTVLILAIMGLVFLLIFDYAPMYGIVLAFKEGDRKLNLMQIILQGDFIDPLFKNFQAILKDYNFKNVVMNTLSLNLLCLVFLFPFPILYALLINEVRVQKARTVLQSIAIFPNFLSWIIFGGIFLSLMDVNLGVFNPIMEFFGISSKEDPVNLGEPQYFYFMMILTSIIKQTGWSSIVYCAAISGLDQEMYEAATVDGANRWQRAIKITLPCIMPTVTVFFLLQISNLLNNNFEHIYTFQNGINLSKAEVLATYSYKVGLAQKRYSFTTALGLIKSVIAIILLSSSNFISKKLSGRGIF